MPVITDSKSNKKSATDSTIAQPVEIEVPQWFSIANHAVNGLFKLTSSLLVLLLVLMSVMIVYQVLSRYVLGSPSSISEEILRYSLIWLGILGAGVACLHGRHLNLPLINNYLSDSKQRALSAFNAIVTIVYGLIMLVGGTVAVSKNVNFETPMLGISIGVFQSVICIAGFLIIVNAVMHFLNEQGINKNTLIAVIQSAVFMAIISACWMWFRSTTTYEVWTFDYLELFSTIVLFTSFFLFLIVGTPIALGLAFSGMITLSLFIETPDLVATVGEKVFGSLDNFGFLALPFFILAGNIMNQGGIAHRLINLAMLLGRRIPGTLWQANILGNILFGSISGSALAASTAIGGIISPMAKEQKYDRGITAALNATSSTSGMMIPPTGIFILYSLLIGGSASIAGLFVAGYIPGLMLAGSAMIMAYVYAKRLNYKADKEPVEVSVYLKTLADALPALSLVIIIMAGIIGGVFTAVEASGIAVLYSFILALFYKSLTFKKCYDILFNTSMTAAVIFFLIACSGLMSWSMTFASIPETIADFLIGFSDNSNVVLAMMVVILIIVGVFMDMTPAILIFTPIFYPIAYSMGIDPIHFGIIIVYTLSIGLVTPPVGPVLFVSCSINETSISEVIKPILPIFGLQIIGAFFIVFIPELSLYLPKLFGVIK
ncbi:MAG: TRAP transporter large permease [Vibrio hibernica]